MYSNLREEIDTYVNEKGEKYNQPQKLETLSSLDLDGNGKIDSNDQTILVADSLISLMDLEPILSIKVSILASSSKVLPDTIYSTPSNMKACSLILVTISLQLS